MANVTEITADKFQAEVVDSSTPVVVDFHGEAWCGPCQMLKPVFDEVSDEYSGKVKFAKVNIDPEENKKLASEKGVMGVPTLIFYKNGEEIDRSTGFMDKNKLKEKIDNAFGFSQQAAEA